MFLLRFHLLAGLAVCAVLLSTSARGLAADDKEAGTINGKITFEGKPLTKGKVSFHPKKGKPTVGEIEKDGSYSVKKVPIGEMRITVESEGVPKKYSDPETSGLAYDVKKGKQTYDVDLRK